MELVQCVYVSGKGDKNRTTSHKKYAEGWARAFEPKEPFNTDAKKHEEAYLTKRRPINKQ
jgi:hypothetical protein